MTTVSDLPRELQAAIDNLVSVYEDARHKAEKNRRLDTVAIERAVQAAAQGCELAVMAGIVEAAVVDAPVIR